MPAQEKKIDLYVKHLCHTSPVHTLLSPETLHTHLVMQPEENIFMVPNYTPSRVAHPKKIMPQELEEGSFLKVLSIKIFSPSPNDAISNISVSSPNPRINSKAILMVKLNGVEMNALVQTGVSERFISAVIAKKKKTIKIGLCNRRLWRSSTIFAV